MPRAEAEAAAAAEAAQQTPGGGLDVNAVFAKLKGIGSKAEQDGSEKEGE